jgi:hypothetical protein
VKRGFYKPLEEFVANKGSFGTVVGPTACGKSTYAILAVTAAGLSVLLLQPTGLNVASCRANFEERMPRTIKTKRLPLTPPSSAHCGFTTLIDSPAQLNISDTDEFYEFYGNHGAYPPADFVLLDEYHLARENHVIVRIMLAHMVLKIRPPIVIFVSATPPDEETPPLRTDGLSINYVEIPDILSTPVPFQFRLSKLKKFGQNLMLTFADCCEVAHEHVSQLKALGEDATSLCACLTPEEGKEAILNHTRDHTFVTTPEAEAGLDLNLSHGVNPNTAVRMYFKDGVLYKGVFRLGPRQVVQRLGRFGRSCHTLVWTQKLDENEVADETLDSCSPVDAAKGAMIVMEATGVFPDGPDCQVACKHFPRLKKVTVEAIRIALKAQTPVMELYRRNTHGVLFREFGGTAPRFVEECGADLRLFMWCGGRAFAPFLDLTTNHDPTTGQTLESIKSLSQAALDHRPHLSQHLDIDRALKYAERDPTSFAEAIWLALKQTKGESNLHSRSTDPTRLTTEYMFGNIGNRAWKVVESLGGYLETKNNGKYIDRTLHFRDDLFKYTSSDVLGEDGRVSNKKITNLLLPHLKPVAITFLLQDDPSVATNLCNFKHALPRCNNDWFRSLSL